MTGDLESRFQLVEKHLRDMDMTMVEVGYRYQELYWAGRDENWEYAAYQLGKIEQSMANGIERRPARAESSRMMQAPVQLLRSVIEGKKSGEFEGPFTALTSICNACHQTEKVGFIGIVTPTVRASPVIRGVLPLPEGSPDSK